MAELLRLNEAGISTLRASGYPFCEMVQTRRWNKKFGAESMNNAYGDLTVPLQKNKNLYLNY